MNIATYGSTHVGEGQDDGKDAKTNNKLTMRHERFLQFDLLLKHGIDLVVGEESAVGGVHFAHLFLVLIEISFVVAVDGWKSYRDIVVRHHGTCR